jgi:hypothetical protein
MSILYVWYVKENNNKSRNTAPSRFSKSTITTVLGDVIDCERLCTHFRGF